MTRTYLKIVGFCLVIFTLTVVIARIVGAAQPANPALAGFSEGCEGRPQPCWYGIVPGVTTMEETLQILNRKGYTVMQLNSSSATNPRGDWEAEAGGALCKVKFQTFPQLSNTATQNIVFVVSSFALDQCAGVRFGDLFLVLENPHLAYGCESKPYSQTRFSSIWINDWRLNPQLRQLTPPSLPLDLIYNLRMGTFGDISEQFWEYDDGWYGFIPAWKLDQIIYEKYCRFG